MGHELPGPPATTIDNKLTILPPSARRLRRADGGRGSPVHGIRSSRSNKAPDTFGYPPRHCGGDAIVAYSGDNHLPLLWRIYRSQDLEPFCGTASKHDS